MEKLIVAHIGFSGSGKDYESDILSREQGFTRIGFSDGVRNATFAYYNTYPKYGIEYDNWKKNIVHVSPEGIEQTGRDLLIKIGESYRAENPLVWSNTWYNSCVKGDYKNIVVNDCRFLHEAAAIIQYAINYNYKIKFIYCNYKSERYNQSNNDTDTFAALFKHEKHLNNITNLILNLYVNAHNTNLLFLS